MQNGNEIEETNSTMHNGVQEIVAADTTTEIEIVNIPQQINEIEVVNLQQTVAQTSMSNLNLQL